MTKPRAAPSRQRTLLVLVAMLLAVIAGLVAAIVTVSARTQTVTTLAVGVCAFVVTVRLVLHILKMLKLL
ncbi:hypothetical protein ACPZ19_37450 [Amycolatopsis lurida]